MLILGFELIKNQYVDDPTFASTWLVRKGLLMVTTDIKGTCLDLGDFIFLIGL